MLAIAAVAASQTFSTPTAEAQAPACDAVANLATFQAIYEATGGENWSRKPRASWLTQGATITNQRWSAFQFNTLPFTNVNVVFDSDGCVTSLRIQGNNMVDEVPNLDAFTRVESIDLSNNQLRGFPDISQLSSLEDLYLNGNQLKGTIKDLGLANLANLGSDRGTVNLSNNNFSGRVLGSAGAVADRDFHPNAARDTGSIDLSGNNFTGPIPDLSANRGIGFLYLQNNRFNELIPDHLPQNTNNTHRYTLHAHNNAFSGELPDLSGRYFTILYLSHNNFSGELDPTHLRVRTELDLSHNNFSGALPDLSDRVDGGANSKILLANNDFSGAIDLDYIKENIELLDLSNNMFSGDIPDFSGRTLRTIDISGNKFNDRTLPSDRFNAEVIRNLRAANLGLSGPVPDFTGFTQIRELDLSGNSFTGTLADLNLDTSIVTHLILSGNMLTGDLSILTELTKADQINLADNMFEGTLVFPSDTGCIDAALRPIYCINKYIVSGNKLTGEFPDLRDRIQLGALVISNNMLSGEINPAFLPRLLREFQFEGNNFDVFPDLSGLDGVGEFAYFGLEMLKGDFVPGFDIDKLPDTLLTLELSGLIDTLPDLSKFTGLTKLILHPANPDLQDVVFGPGFDIDTLPDSLQTFDLNGLSGPFPDFSRFKEFTELVLYPANDFKGVVNSKNVPIDGELTRLVIGHTLDVPGEDADNPDRMCADKSDTAFVTWAERSNTTFVGAYCGQASGGGGSVVRLARIEPGIGDVRVRAGDDVKLSVNIFGRQGRQDQSLGDAAIFVWSVGDNALAGTGSSISYTAPSSPGTYTVTASLPESQCHGLDDSEANCTATFEVQVLRSSPAPIPTASPSDPPGVPEILADSDGNQYEVFTPVSGGSFSDGMVMLTADAGAIPNGEVVGLRVDAAGAASNAGMTHQRYTLAGDAYTVSAVDISGASVSDYRLNSPAQLCVPLPDALRANISDLAMLVSNPDGSLTVLSTTVHVSGNGVLGCGNISTVPATVALGTSGAPAAIPTATPEPTPIPPDTGGYTPTTTATPWLLLLLLGTITTAVASTLVLRRRRASSDV